MRYEKVETWATAFILAFVSAMLLYAGGCASLMEGLSNLAGDPNSSGALESGAAGAAGIAALFGPIGGLIAGGIGTGLTIWRKMKPKLAAANTKATQYHAAGVSIVTAIEDFKRAYPKEWQVLGARIEERLKYAGVDPLTVENVIRGMRGLEPKEAV